MTKEEVYINIATGEGLHLDFKRAMHNSHSKTMVAFANAKGGKIILGVEDDGTIVGHHLTNEERSKIESIARDCDPSVNISLEITEIEPNLSITVIDVPKSANSPHRCTAGYYLRVGSESVKMSTQQLTDYLNAHGAIGFDEFVRKEYLWKDIFDVKLIVQFKSHLSASAQLLSDSALLQNLNLIKGDHPTNAGILLLAKNAADYLPQFLVRCVAYKGDDTGTMILDHKDFGDHIFSVVEDGVSFLLKHLNAPIIIKGIKREQSPEIPVEALREALVNAVVHRDYNIKGANIKVEVFVDRIEISSPGSLAPGMEVTDLGKRSLARNAVITDALSRTPYMEKLGTGINRINNALKKANLDGTDYQVSTGFFTVVFKRPEPLKTPEVAPQDTPQDTPQVTPQVKKLLLALNGEMTAGELRDKTGYSDREYFRKNVLHVAVNQLIVEMTVPDKPSSKNQKYRLTRLGQQVKSQLSG